LNQKKIEINEYFKCYQKTEDSKGKELGLTIVKKNIRITEKRHFCRK